MSPEECIEAEDFPSTRRPFRRGGIDCGCQVEARDPMPSAAAWTVTHRDLPEGDDGCTQTCGLCGKTDKDLTHSPALM